MMGLAVYRVAAFVTDALPEGRYVFDRVDDQWFTISLPERASPWDVLRLTEALSVGPLTAERANGGVVVTDARWSSLDTTADSDVVADGGMQTPSGGDEAVPEPPSDPFAVSDDDDPRTKRARTEELDVSLLQKGGVYEVHSASDSYYEVDVAAEECSCPDTAERCKHRRRVELEIGAGLVPRPDGRLP